MKLALWFLCLTLGFCHPHIFIDTKVTVEKEKIGITWVFDEMSSSMLIADYDKNRNKTLEKNEIDFMEKDHFKSLAAYSFFSAFVIKDDESKINNYMSFNAFVEKGRLNYYFEIAKPKSKLYEILFYDPERYVALVVNKKDVKCYSGTTCESKGHDADFYYVYKVIVKEP